jgi:hypothetical protein
MGDPPPVLETLRVFVSNTNYNNIATSMQSLHEMQVLAEQYIKAQVSTTPVWLHAQMDGETNERRALVRSITIQYKPQWFGVGQSTLNIPEVITVVREPYWERTTARNFPDNSPSAAASVTYNYTAAGTGVSAHDIVGDVGARIDIMRWFAASGDTLANFWMGIRSTNLRTSDEVTNFVNIWELEDGTNEDAEVADTVDATASGGNRITVTPVGGGTDWDDGSFHDVSMMAIDDATGGSNNDDQIGAFQWLVRCKVTSGTWEIQVRFGYTGWDDGDYYRGPIVEVANTSWYYKEGGIATLPINKIRLLDAATGGYAISLYARRTSGSGDLHIDCYCPIPTDEGFLKYDGDEVATINEVIIGQDPRGIWETVISDTPVAIGTLESIENFVLPPGDGRIICVYTNDTASDITDRINFNDVPADSEYFERWLSLRGSE